LFTARYGGAGRELFDNFNLATHVGDSQKTVVRNREILAENLGIPVDNLFFMNQVHGNQAAVITHESDPENPPTADALFTTMPGVALVVLVADCIPLLMQSDKAVAAVHVGRKGLLSGVFQETLNAFNRQKIKNSEIKAFLGASICGNCYEVGQDVFQEVVSVIPAAATKNLSANNRPCLDIEAGLISLLDNEGVQWSSTRQCTVHDPGFFSYRRDGVTGRQAGVIWLDRESG
jgi:YfiH family protein